MSSDTKGGATGPQCNVQPNHLLKNFPAACNLGTKDCILFHVGDISSQRQTAWGICASSGTHKGSI